MGAVAVVLILAGVWMVYGAVNNIAPLQTLVQIVKDPANAREQIRSEKSKISKTGLLPSAAVVPTAGAGGGGSAIAEFALRQVGKRYVFGAAGPDTWDCSGLTMAAVKYGTGIDIPHLVSLQLASSKGHTVAKADLQPGDLVFPSPAHVGVYIGGGQMVDAANPAKGVVKRPMFGFLGAKRFVVPTGTAGVS